MLSVKDLVKVYKAKKGGAEVRALDGVSIDFPECGMVFLLGKSGSGKSTLLNVAGGLDKPDSGEIIVKGKSSKDFIGADFDSYRNTYIGFIFQEYNILNEFNVETNISLALQLQGKKNDEEAVNKILEEVELSGLGKRKPNTLSGGQKQRVAIARALIKDPKIIMADEPTGSLDSETGKQVFDTLKKLSQDRLVIVVSHDREFAQKYGDRIIELKDGKILSDENKMPESDYNKYEKDETNFIKSKLPLKHAVKMGAHSVKTKPLRLVLTVFISLLAFGMFGIMSTMMMYDINYSVAKALEGTPYSSVTLQKYYKSENIEETYGFYKGEEYHDTKKIIKDNYTRISPAELDKLKNENKDMLFAGIIIPYADALMPKLGIFNTIGNPDFGYYSGDELIGYCDAGENYLKNVFGNDVCLAGSYPTGPDEVAVSEYMYEVFQRNKLSLYDTASGKYEGTAQINSPQDLIGKYINTKFFDTSLNLKITGVYRTGMIDAKYDELKENMPDYSITKNGLTYYELSKEFIEIVCNGYHNLAYVSETFYKDKALDSRNQIYLDDGLVELFYTDYYYYKELPGGRGSTLFILPEILEKHSEKIELYSFTDGAKMPFSELKSLKADEAFISARQLFTRAELLYNSEKTSGNESIEKYKDSHTGFVNAYNKLNYFLHYKWPKDAGQKPAQRTLSQEDIAVILNALNADWNSWVKDVRNSKNPASQIVYVDADKGYYNFDGKYLKIKGIHITDMYNGDSLLMSNEFLKSIGSTYSYTLTESTTKYIVPSDAKYSAVITPIKTSIDNLNYIFSFSKAAADGSFYKMANNDIYSEAESKSASFKQFEWLFIAIGVALAAVSALFLFNYISVSISDKKRDIGILRAMGAKGTDVFKIFFTESIIIAAICAVLAIILSIIACVVVNMLMVESIFAIQLLNFRFVNALIIFGIAALVAFAGTIIPVTTAAKKVPIDSIRSL